MSGSSAHRLLRAGLQDRSNKASGSPCRDDLRAVDLERALFVLADSGRMDQARLLLEGPCWDE